MIVTVCPATVSVPVPEVPTLSVTGRLIELPEPTGVIETVPV